MTSRTASPRWTADEIPVLSGSLPAPTSSPLRLLLVTARYVPYTGGVEIHTYEVARRLAAAGHDVTVLTTDPGGRLMAVEEAEGVHILRVKAWPTNRDYYFAPEIYRVIVNGHWDLIHCQGCHNLVPPLAMLAAIQSRIPYVVTFHSGGHSSRVRRSLRGVQWRMLRPLLARAERLIAVSTFEERLFRAQLRLPAEQFAVIPNGGGLPDGVEQPPSQADERLIVSVGRLERYKGHHRVIAAMPHVVEQCPDARLLILGTGPYQEELRQLATRLGVTDRVEIRGVSGTDRAGMARVLSRASLVTLLSEYEAHPVAVMETLALGRPVLAARTAGLGELADRGLVRGIPLESTDDEVAQAVLYNLSHPLVPENLRVPTWDECATQLLSLYRDVVGSCACAS